jgi:hypothetical protein
MPLTVTRRLKAKDLFDTLEKEKEQAKDNKIEVKSDSKLEEIIKDFEKIFEKAKSGGIILQSFYFDLKEIQKYSSKDIEKFSLTLSRYKDPKYFNPAVGIFLSYLINNSEDKEFVVHTNHLEDSIQGIGYSNSKEIIIKGNSGSNLGRDMKSGKIIVDGDTQEDIGHNMSGGSIEVNGNSNSQIGYFMSGGEIILRGNSGNYLGGFMEKGTIISFGDSKKGVGLCMKGGKIYLEGEYKSITTMIQGGDIYHKGKLIIKDGKEVPGANLKWG